MQLQNYCPLTPQERSGKGDEDDGNWDGRPFQPRLSSTACWRILIMILERRISEGVMAVGVFVAPGDLGRRD